MGWSVVGNVANNAEGATSGSHGAALTAGHDSQGDTLSQTFSTQSGHVYSVDFDAGIYGQRAGNSLQLQVQVFGSGALLNQLVTPPEAHTFTPSAVTFQHFHFTFTANSTNATLRFTSIGAGNSNADQVVDTISIVQIGTGPTPTPTPTPSPGPTPTVRIATSSVLVNEGATATVTITASTAPVTPLTVFYHTTGTAGLGSDYSLSGTVGSVVIPAGQTSATIQFTALTDLMTTEKKETAKLTLTAGNGYKVPKKAGKTVTIKVVNVP
jgi:hypothetical protein